MDGHYYISVACTRCGNTIAVPVYCGDRFCPVCGAPRRARIRNRISFLVKQVDLKQGMRIKHLTLTIRNQKCLFDMLKDLTRSFRKLRSRAIWKNHVVGGAFVIEVTGSPGNWHAHIHAVIESYYLDFHKLLNTWIKCSPGQGVYIQNLPLNAVVTYLTKYLTKPDMPDQVSEQVSLAISGYRLFQPFGTWYSISLTYHKPRCLCKECGSKSFELAYRVGLSFDLRYWVAFNTSKSGVP